MTNRFNSAVLTLTTVAAFSVILPAIHLCGWFRADAQVPPAPTGHRQPTAAEISKAESGNPAQKTPPVSPEDLAMERALNNICRGCSTPVAVDNVPRYDVGVEAKLCPAGKLSKGYADCTDPSRGPVRSRPHG